MIVCFGFDISMQPRTMWNLQLYNTKQLAPETKRNVHNLRKQRNSRIYTLSLSSFPARWHGKWSSMLCIFIWYKQGLFSAANFIFVPFWSPTIFSTLGPAVPLTTFLYTGLLSLWQQIIHWVHKNGLMPWTASEKEIILSWLCFWQIWGALSHLCFYFVATILDSIILAHRFVLCTMHYVCNHIMFTNPTLQTCFLQVWLR